MDHKNNKKNHENQVLSKEASTNDKNTNSGIYLRDDHCDWGSSGMNEFTKEFTNN